MDEHSPSDEEMDKYIASFYDKHDKLIEQQLEIAYRIEILHKWKSLILSNDKCIGKYSSEEKRDEALKSLDERIKTLEASLMPLVDQTIDNLNLI